MSKWPWLQFCHHWTFKKWKLTLSCCDIKQTSNNQSATIKVGKKQLQKKHVFPQTSTSDIVGQMAHFCWRHNCQLWWGIVPGTGKWLTCCMNLSCFGQSCGCVHPLDVCNGNGRDKGCQLRHVINQFDTANYTCETPSHLFFWQKRSRMLVLSLSMLNTQQKQVTEVL